MQEQHRRGVNVTLTWSHDDEPRLLVHALLWCAECRRHRGHEGPELDVLSVSVR